MFGFTISTYIGLEYRPWPTAHLRMHIGSALDMTNMTRGCIMHDEISVMMSREQCLC